MVHTNQILAPGVFVFEEKKLIYLHTPKCAGFSVVDMLRKSMPQTSGRFGHTPAIKIIRYLESQRESGYTIMSSIRNPWDRLVSAYYFISKGGIHKRDRVRRLCTLTLLKKDFHAFVSFLPRWGFMFNFPFRNSCIHSALVFPVIHFLPQTYWLCNEKGEIATTKLLRCESLGADLNQLFQEKLLKPQIVAHRNKTDHLDYRELYTEKTKNIVQSVYRRDIELFGYSFEDGASE